MLLLLRSQGFLRFLGVQHCKLHPRQSVMGQGMTFKGLRGQLEHAGNANTASGLRDSLCVC